MRHVADVNEDVGHVADVNEDVAVGWKPFDGVQRYCYKAHTIIGI